MTQLAIMGRVGVASERLENVLGSPRHIEIDACTTSRAPSNSSFSDRAATTPRSCSTSSTRIVPPSKLTACASIARFRKEVTR